MTQRALIDSPEFIGTAAVIPAPAEQLPAVAADAPAVARPSPLATLREHALSVPVETMKAGLADYWDRRRAFREWLLSKLVEGVHFGTPPGCEPKGNVNEKQWQHKPSLYKAGADFICDLLGARPEYKADNDAWLQLGSEKGKFVFACHLFSSANGQLIGEGRGARRVGQKGGDENNAIKMAMKAAKVDAVINSWGLSDLFTQDVEDGIQPPHDNPSQTADAPKVKPRGNRPPGKRGNQTDLGAFFTAYRACSPPSDCTIEIVTKWVEKIIGRKIENVKQPDEWTADELKQCMKALEAGQ